MRSFVVFCIWLLFSAGASAGGGEGLWVFVVARLCVGQDTGYRQSLLGRMVTQGRFDLKSPEFDKCVRQKNWIPRKVCDEVMSLESEEAFSRGNLERLRGKYASELRVLSVAGEYYAAFDKAEAAGTAVPSCPSDTAGPAPSRPPDIFAGANDRSLAALSSPVALIHEWRLTPGVLLEHCAKEAPQQEPAMRATYDAWLRTNESLIFGIDRVVDKVVRQYASAVAVGDSEAKDRVVAFTNGRIANTYLKRDDAGASPACANYDKIIADLSRSGRTSSIRGFVYATEMMLSAQNPASSGRAQSTGKGAN